MKHEEFKNLLNKNIKYGDTVWVCDYRHNDILEKPIRHVEPQKVFVVCNSELPKNKTVYYSDFHFRPVGNKGQMLSKIIAPFDNTGYRSYTGVSLNIFLTKEECIEHYIKQCNDIKDSVESERKRVSVKLNQMIDDVNENIKKFEIR